MLSIHGSFSSFVHSGHVVRIACGAHLQLSGAKFLPSCFAIFFKKKWIPELSAKTWGSVTRKFQRQRWRYVETLFQKGCFSEMWSMAGAAGVQGKSGKEVFVRLTHLLATHPLRRAGWGVQR